MPANMPVPNAPIISSSAICTSRATIPKEICGAVPWGWHSDPVYAVIDSEGNASLKKY